MKRWLVIIGVWFLCATPVVASEKFYTRHEVKYTFDANGKSTVEQNVSLTNKESGFYASSYQITIQGDPPGTISGNDSTGPLKIDVTHPSSDTTVANISFNDQVVGKDKTLNFSISYSGRPAAHNGQVWEISLPKVGTGDIDEYNLHLTTPASFGQLAFISPSPVSSENRQYNFNLSQIKNVGVVAAFGNFQAYDFTLRYQLDNPNPRKALAEIPLPPDTNYQRIYYSAIDPEPSDIKLDDDGNWIATYIVEAKQNLTVVASGQVHLLAEPTQTRPGLSERQKQQYLQPTQYWPSTNTEIKELSRHLTTPQLIYDYVVSTLKYDQSRIGVNNQRKGGLEALKTPQSSICTEFTDLFITLARAAGIPAREVDGYGYTTNRDLRPSSLGNNLFHAWPQYWDDNRQTWVSVDPTWGNTTGGVDYFNKLDFNHFAFLNRGVTDSSPTLSVSSAEVKYGTYKEFPAVSPQINWSAPKQILPLVTNKSEVEITNPLGLAIYQIPISVNTLNISSQFIGPSEIGVLLPFSTQKFPLLIKSPFWPDFLPKKATIFVANQPQIYNIEAKLFLLWQISLGIIIATIITTLGWLASKAWGLYVQKRNRPGTVRR